MHRILRVTGTTLLSLMLVASCGGDEKRTSRAELLSDASCQGKALTRKSDREALLAMLPESRTIDAEYRGNKPEYWGSTRCILFRNGKYSDVQIASDFLEETPLPRGGDTAIFATTDIYNGKWKPSEPRAVKDARGDVVGTSVRSGASLSVTCRPPASKHSKRADGVLSVVVSASNAPKPNSDRQRDNALGVAVSYLEHVARGCANKPRLPDALDVPR